MSSTDVKEGVEEAEVKVEGEAEVLVEEVEVEVVQARPRTALCDRRAAVLALGDGVVEVEDAARVGGVDDVEQDGGDEVEDEPRDDPRHHGHDDNHKHLVVLPKGWDGGAALGGAADVAGRVLCNRVCCAAHLRFERVRARAHGPS